MDTKILRWTKKNNQPEDCMTKEIWRWVVGYKGYYKVSDLGRVKSVGKFCKTKSSLGEWTLREIKPRILKQSWRDGRLCVVLSKKGKRTTFRVHKLVLEAFIGPCPSGMECCHRNDEREDNELTNLYWGTHV